MERVITIERLGLSVMLRRKLVLSGVNSIRSLLDIRNNNKISLTKVEFEEIENSLKKVGLVLYADNKFVDNLDLNTKLKNVVKKTGVNTFDELKSIAKEQVLKIPEVGELSAEKIIDSIEKFFKK